LSLIPDLIRGFIKFVQHVGISIRVSIRIFDIWVTLAGSGMAVALLLLLIHPPPLNMCYNY